MILLVRLLLRLLADVGRFAALLFKPHRAITAENLVLRRQIALFEEQGMKPRRIAFGTKRDPRGPLSDGAVAYAMGSASTPRLLWDARREPSMSSARISD